MKIKSIFVLSMMLFAVVRSANAQETTTFPQQATDISPLLIGESIPDFTLPDLQGKAVKLKEQLAAKPTLLIFYRGGWCPYCNRQMADLMKVEEEIVKLGYQIIAISPDDPAHLRATMDKNQLTYQLLSDADMKLSAAMGLAYAVPEASVQRLKDASDNKNPGALPVPAVFIVNQAGEIEYEYINPNYKSRIKGELLLATLKALK
ncbi:peroxiredoxin [Dyadobacter jejuensis]|uniref:thioredoxin-dependent peroxiredoxin n=1 Tax=Dyadobacter jejuensis TaxID=1082580 RepID=A0A316AMQ0_9BACT|nr:redoxin domain-containing protein [Dyadobacter jejuensis]PWJ58728.1 peroxiredoxin [Dyadobacter jejuensis]